MPDWSAPPSFLYIFLYYIFQDRFPRLSISACQTVLSVALSSSCIKSTDRQHIPSRLSSGSRTHPHAPSDPQNHIWIPNPKTNSKGKETGDCVCA